MSLAPLVDPADSLSVDEVRRYSRHLIIPDVGMSGQKRLKNAKVLCVGAGGLGSPTLMYLAAAGVGTLGIVDHRLPEDRDTALEKSSGYLKVSTIRRIAEGAGFEYVGASKVNANPKDTADWEKGVWTLPPTLRNGEVDRAKYVAIGESDRFTLKFVKTK